MNSENTREMSLLEWVSKLPKFHKVNKEYEIMISENEKMRKLLSEMGEYLDTNELTSIGSTSNFHRQIKDVLNK